MYFTPFQNKMKKIKPTVIFFAARDLKVACTSGRKCLYSLVNYF